MTSKKPTRPPTLGEEYAEPLIKKKVKPKTVDDGGDALQSQRND
jgi:hypothetical protein